MLPKEIWYIESGGVYVVHTTLHTCDVNFNSADKFCAKFKRPLSTVPQSLAVQ